MTTQHIIEGLTFWGATNVIVLGFLGWIALRDWFKDRRFEREYRAMVAAQSRERVR